jgi:hypothetical protein
VKLSSMMRSGGFHIAPLSVWSLRFYDTLYTLHYLHALMILLAKSNSDLS